MIDHRIAALGFRVHGTERAEAGAAADLEQVVDMSLHQGCDSVVVDSYHVNGNYLGRLRLSGLYVVAIDDLARFRFPCQLVVNGGAHAQQLHYTSSRNGTRFLLGPRYTLLRPEFWKTPHRAARNSVKEILVTLGGRDPEHLMPKLLSSLDDLPADFAVTAILGPFFKNHAQIQRRATVCRRLVRLVDAPHSVRDLMLRADLAVSAGGQTLYELAATGTPTVALQVADNQKNHLKALAAKGVVRIAGRVGDPRLVDKVGKAVLGLVESSHARKRMMAAGRRLMDGRGAVRVARVLVSGESRR
jgi:spore coat polysaccharide biosynthesis predicted glycosyltransferase SpsG